MGRPSLSRIDTGNCTSSVSTLMLYGACFCGCGLSCASRAAENNKTVAAKIDLLSMVFAQPEGNSGANPCLQAQDRWSTRSTPACTARSGGRHFWEDLLSL